MATQEVQAMLMDDKVLITANEANTTGAIAKLLAGKKSPKEFIAAWKQMYDEGLANVKSKSAEEEKIKPEDFNIVAAWIYQHTDTLSGKGGKVNVGQIDRPGVKNDLDELQFIIVHCQSVYKDIHAEQTLLALLAAQLKEGKLPQEVHVAGTKMPCSTCFDVLQANYEALKKHYPSVSFFVGDHWTKNNMGNDDVLKLHQTGLIPEDDPQKGNVYNQYRKDFVELQKKVYKPKKK